ncbi:alanine:cation symporter family protein [Staphylococcus aureus]
MYCNIFIGGPGAVFWMWITAFRCKSALLNLHLVKYSREFKIMNTVVDQRIILNMVLVENLVKFTELSLLLLRLSQ